mmetsp:Transcript_19402/g.60335  ORF Transcript_19402/g.60335 Transcript_19402/m.60335 type:complete len:257 (+) Transcript_19402:157-927(+)
MACAMHSSRQCNLWSGPGAASAAGRTSEAAPSTGRGLTTEVTHQLSRSARCRATAALSPSSGSGGRTPHASKSACVDPKLELSSPTRPLPTISSHSSSNASVFRVCPHSALTYTAGLPVSGSSPPAAGCCAPRCVCSCSACSAGGSSAPVATSTSDAEASACSAAFPSPSSGSPAAATKKPAGATAWRSTAKRRLATAASRKRPSGIGVASVISTRQPCLANGGGTPSKWRASSRLGGPTTPNLRSPASAAETSAR